MKTLLFCNLIPLKTGAYETLLSAVGEEFRKAGDEYVVVFAGEPIPPVADSLRVVGIRWRILEGWIGDSVSREAAKPAKKAEKQTSFCDFAISRLRVKNSSAERVRPWGFVWPALRIIREERPDVVAVHFGNELPTLAASLLCRVLARWTQVVDLMRGRKDILTRSREAGEEDGFGSASGGKKTIPFASSRLRVRNSWLSPRWVWEQDQQIQDPGRLSRHLSKLRLLGLGVDRFLAVYEGGKESMLKRGIPAEKISVIYNSIAPYTPTRPKGWLRAELRIREVEEKIGSREAAKPAKGEMGVSLGMSAGSPADSRTEEEGCDEKSSSFPSVQTSSAPSSRLRVSESSSADSGNQKVLLVTTGSLIPRKRIDFLIRAFAALEVGKQKKSIAREGAKPTKEENNSSFAFSRLRVRQIPSWRLLIIGEGPERARLAALATELGIADRVHFLGLRNDIREILPECDIYLHASLAETCTYAITESMAAGIPAVVTVAGAAREQIDSGHTGYVLDRDDAEGFAMRLGELMEDSARRSSMGQAAQARWNERYRVEVAAKQFAAMYRNVAGEAKQARSSRNG